MEIDVSVVTYHSSKWLDGFFASLVNQCYPTKKMNIYLRDNGSADDTVAICEALIKKHANRFNHIEINIGKNIGFGAGHNDHLKRGKADFFLVTNVDLTFEEQSIATIVESAVADDVKVASWEFRQKPFEHPKYYNPVTLETTWSSSACILFRRAALEKVGGYEERIFLYGEDVELSYRLRDHGFILKYCPKAVCWHYSYEHAHELKPAQFFGSAMTNVLIRCRYGSVWQTIQGFLLYLLLFIRPVPVKNKTKKLVKNFIRVCCLAPYFLRTRKKSHAHFPMRLWDYEMTRPGAFYEHLQIATDAPSPLVSVIIRTYQGRLAWLKQAVTSVLNQTYSSIELVVIEDGSNTAETFINEVRNSAKLNKVIYQSISKGGRCVAGNAGLAVTTGEFLVFLDDDDLFFAEHIEILADALIKNTHHVAAYSLAYQVPTNVISTNPLQYKEASYDVVLKQEFSQSLLWNFNFLSIQSVLFRRFLYEKQGGFDEKLNYLEDWDLWIRFSLAGDFLFIKKLTSLYRTPADVRSIIRRYRQLRSSYHQVINKRQRLFVHDVPWIKKLSAKLACLPDSFLVVGYFLYKKILKRVLCLK